jgi:hypothetical protein
MLVLQVARIIPILSNRADFNGTYRANFAVATFNRISDLENFRVVKPCYIIDFLFQEAFSWP